MVLLTTLIVYLLAAPAIADKDDAFFVDKRDFRKSYKTIALTPIDSDPVLNMPASVASMIEAEITKHLERRGFTVLPSSVLGDIRASMTKQIGGVTYPDSDQTDPARLQIMRGHASRELWFKHKPDVLASVRVRVTRGAAASDRVEWHGVTQKMQSKGRGNYSARVPVSSVTVVMVDQTDNLLYAYDGGLEVLMRREKDQFLPLPAESYFQDEKRIRKAANVAVDPI